MPMRLPLPALRPHRRCFATPGGRGEGLREGSGSAAREEGVEGDGGEQAGAAWRWRMGWAMRKVSTERARFFCARALLLRASGLGVHAAAVLASGPDARIRTGLSPPRHSFPFPIVWVERGGEVQGRCGRGRMVRTPSARLSQSGTGRMARFSSCPRSLASGRAPVKVLRVSRSGCAKRTRAQDRWRCVPQQVGDGSPNGLHPQSLLGGLEERWVRGWGGGSSGGLQSRTCPPSARKKKEKNSQASCC